MSVAQGDNFRRARDWRSAIESYKRALTANGDDARAHASLALALLGLRRIDGAEAEAELALAFEPDAAFAHVAVATVRVAQRRLDDAWLHCELALGSDRRDLDARLLGASILTQQGDLGGARRLLDEALALEPGGPTVLAALAQHALRIGALDDARRWAEQAADDAPDSLDTRLAAAAVALARGQIYDAERHCRAALARDPVAEALQLWAQIQRRRSAVVGSLWTIAVLTLVRDQRAQVGGLIASFIAAQVGIVIAHALEYDAVGNYLMYAWFAWCLYTWLAPGLFRSWVQRELRTVHREGN